MKKIFVLMVLSIFISETISGQNKTFVADELPTINKDMTEIGLLYSIQEKQMYSGLGIWTYTNLKTGEMESKLRVELLNRVYLLSIDEFSNMIDVYNYYWNTVSSTTPADDIKITYNITKEDIQPLTLKFYWEAKPQKWYCRLLNNDAMIELGHKEQKERWLARFENLKEIMIQNTKKGK